MPRRTLEDVFMDHWNLCPRRILNLVAEKVDSAVELFGAFAAKSITECLCSKGSNHAALDEISAAPVGLPTKLCWLWRPLDAFALGVSL